MGWSFVRCRMLKRPDVDWELHFHKTLLGRRGTMWAVKDGRAIGLPKEAVRRDVKALSTMCFVDVVSWARGLNLKEGRQRHGRRIG